MTLPADLARIRAFSSTPDVPSLTPPPQYERSPLMGAYEPWRTFQEMAALHRSLWEAYARLEPFEVLNDVRERCERVNATAGRDRPA